MPTRRWPPAESAASITGSDVRPTPVAANVAPGGQMRQAGGQRLRRPGHAAGHAHDQVDVHVPAVRRAVPVEQPGQRGQVAEVEHLVLRHDPPLLHLRVQLDDQVPRVAEHVAAEVDRAQRQRGGVGLGVEDGQPRGRAGR